MSLHQLHQNEYRNDLPISCETEKRIKINKHKKIFFEKFVN